jgi:thiamine pyrophosphate-dependent acetolactate synthase large subunit-like protein
MIDIVLSEAGCKQLVEQALQADVALVIQALEQSLKEWEYQFGMSTAEMRKLVSEEQMPETAEILAWLKADNQWKHLRSQHG